MPESRAPKSSTPESPTPESPLLKSPMPNPAPAPAAKITLDNAREFVGREIAVSDWLAVDQARIDEFARATGDDYWIHTDPARAARESPFGAAIAHGFLTLSLLTKFYYECVRAPSDEATGLNYGLDRVRFLSPVRAGDRVRARFALEAVEDKAPGQQMFVFACSVEVEGQDKPALVAIWRNFYIRQAPPVRGPRLTEKGQASQAARRAREAEALRANLARRKTQARAKNANDAKDAKDE